MTKAEQIQAIIDKQVADIKAKGVTLPQGDDAKSSETVKAEKALSAKFFKAVADKDAVALREVSTEAREQYKALTDGQNITNDADGGYLVPVTVSNQIIDELKYISPIRQFATVLNLGAKTKINIGGTKPVGYWVAEGEAIPRSKVTFTQKDLTLHKIAGLGGLTYEAINDTVSSPDLQAYLVSQFANAIAVKEIGAFVNGDGVGKPFGFRSADITPKAVTATDISYSSLVALKFGLTKVYRDGGVFMMNGTNLQKVVSLKDDNGRPLYMDNMKTEGGYETLLARPVVEVNEIPNNEVWYVTLKDYIIGDGSAVRVDIGTEGDDFKTDKISVRVIHRVAGRPTLSEGFAKLTLSSVSV